MSGGIYGEKQLAAEPVEGPGLKAKESVDDSPPGRGREENSGEGDSKGHQRDAEASGRCKLVEEA